MKENKEFSGPADCPPSLQARFPCLVSVLGCVCSAWAEGSVSPRIAKQPLARRHHRLHGAQLRQPTVGETSRMFQLSRCSGGEGELSCTFSCSRCFVGCSVMWVNGSTGQAVLQPCRRVTLLLFWNICGWWSSGCLLHRSAHVSSRPQEPLGSSFCSLSLFSPSPPPFSLTRTNDCASMTILGQW